MCKQHLFIIVVEVKTSGHVLRLWLGVSKGMLPVKYFHSSHVPFVSFKFYEDHQTVTRLR